MKNFIQIPLKNTGFFAIIAFALVLNSCSSYQTAMTDNDGIYDSDDSPKTTEIAKNQKEVPDTSNETKPVSALKYENYFKNKAAKIKIETDEIFTDVDSYSSTDTDEELLDKDVTDFSTNDPTWEESGETVVNIYNYPSYRPYLGWYRPYYPYYSGLYIGINPWWNIGYEYYLTGYDYYNPYYYSPYYYGGFYGNYYGYYYNPYYYYNTYPYYHNHRYGRRNTSRNYTTSRSGVRRNIRRSQNHNSTGTSTRNTIRSNTRSNNVRSSNTRSQHNYPRRNTPRVRSNTHSTPRVHSNTHSTPRRTKTSNSPVRRTSHRNYSSSSNHSNYSSSGNRSSFSHSNRNSSGRR